MTNVDAPPPPPPPRAPPAPPPLPYIDPDQLRPSKRWYWLAAAIVAVGTLTGLALAIANAVDHIGDSGFHLSLESYIASIGGGGIGAIIGGVTWSRRTDHRRRLQQEAMNRRGSS